MLDITKCKKCGLKLTKKRVIKIYDDRYRVWCWCGHENFYYKDSEAEQKKVDERIEKARLEKEEKEVKE